MRRSKQQWLELIQAQQDSELSISDFCREHDIAVKYFYSRRSDLLKPEIPEADVEPSSFSQVVVADRPKPASTVLSLNVGKATLSIPSSTDAIWLAKLMEQFA